MIMRKHVKGKAAILLAVSLLLLGVPAGVLLTGGQTAMEVHAEEGDGPAEENGEETVSGNTVSEAVCTCREKCTEGHVEQSCEVCKTDYNACAYVNPSVRITINTPSGWHNDTTKVYISVEDLAQSGNFAVQSLQAKVTQNGNWMDITEERYVEINEDCTVYALVTDQTGRIYEKSRYIKCFDYTAPTLNAAVSDGLLTIYAQDTGSGIKVVYVNGHEFKDLVNGTLNIRLQQFDTGYQYFTISAMDNVGNMSEVYKTKNPYYSDPEMAGTDQDDALQQLPASAQATSPVTATAQVTEHTKTDSEGNTTSETSLEEQKKAAMQEADASEAETEQTGKASEKGKEFYTIQTKSEKVFYLVIDRDGDEEMVYFLTEISENDLLNVTSDLKETLPKNSAVAESALPKTESVLPVEDTGIREEESETPEPEGEAEETAEPVEETEENTAAVYIILGIAAAAVIGAAYYFKVLRKKDEDFLDEEDDDDEDDEEYDDEDEETEEEDSVDPEEEFFADEEDERV